MTDIQKIEVLFILDRSGSMSDLVPETRGAVNRIITEQKALPGELAFSLILFDDIYERLYWRKPIDSVRPLDNKINLARGATALYDAVGIGISRISEALASEPEEQRPGKVIVYILTDGMENSSKKFTFNQIKEMIQHQKEKNGWEFHFISSDLTAVENSRNLGVSSSLYFDKSGRNMDKWAYATSMDIANRRRPERNLSNLDMPAFLRRASGASSLFEGKSSLDEIPDEPDASSDEPSKS